MKASIMKRNEVESWIFDCATPVWIEHGIDNKYGGFFEAIDPDRMSPIGDTKRLRTTTRQIYVFCELSARGLKQGPEIVNSGINFLLNKYSREDGSFHERVDRSGRADSEETSLYDLAFCLFALAKADVILNDDRIFIAAERLITFITSKMRHPLWGFVEHLPHQEFREQNPHMHLLEATLSWLDHKPDSKFRVISQEIMDIFEERFFERKYKCISEFPETQKGTPVDKHRFEAGHHFEWIWLFFWARRHGIRVPNLTEHLSNTALSKGISLTTQIPYGACSSEGNVLETDCRIWQVTEWVRAAVLGLLPRTLDEDPRSINLLKKYLDFPIHGLWYERVDSTSSEMIKEPVKATSLYHIIGALASIIDVEKEQARTQK